MPFTYERRSKSLKARPSISNVVDARMHRTISDDGSPAK